MAATYLPVEMQDDQGRVIHPQTDADIVWTQDGRNVEEVLKSKMEMVVSKVAIPVENRKKGVMYVFVEGENAAAKAAAVKASPAVGYKMI